jgi:hypothetical protein
MPVTDKITVDLHVRLFCPNCDAVMTVDDGITICPECKWPFIDPLLTEIFEEGIKKCT